MKVVAIEIAEAIEKEIVTFLEANSEAASMRFTRFIDLGGKQVELFLYPPQLGASVWCTIGVKTVFKADEGDCVVYFARIPSTERKFENVLVNPSVTKLPAMVERILNFLKEDLLRKVSERGNALEGGGLALGSEQDVHDSAGHDDQGNNGDDASGRTASETVGVEDSDASPLSDISETSTEEGEIDESSDSDPDAKKEG